MFWGAARYTVFDDEAFSCQRYVLPLGDMMSALWHGQEPDPPLYYLLINGWTRLFGVGPLGLRSLSIVISLLGLLVIRRAGAAWSDPVGDETLGHVGTGRSNCRAGTSPSDDRVGDLALTLCALHPAHLFFGFAARWYSLMFLTTALLLWATARLARHGPDVSPVACRGTALSSGQLTSAVLEQSSPVGAEEPSPRRQPGGASRQSPASPVGAKESSASPLVPRIPPEDAPTLRRPNVAHAEVWPHVLAWSLAAAAVCYTNYFGGVVAAMMWLAGFCLARARRRPARPWLVAGVIAVALYSPWLVPLYHQAAAFPAPDASLRSIAAAAARTTMALTTGNLASFAAWWVWLPMGLFCLSLAVLLVRRWRRVWPLAVITLGCFVVGVLTRTIIDKYILTFTAPACVLAAALLVRRPSPVIPHRPSLFPHPSSLIPHPSSFLLLLAWLACAFNLVTETHWSSLRWLDPFEQALVDIRLSPETTSNRTHMPSFLISSHPSVLYYQARFTVREYPTAPPRGLLDMWLAELAATRRENWRIVGEGYYKRPFLGPRSRLIVLTTPQTIIRWPPPPAPQPKTLVTLETTGFAELPEWNELHRILQRDYLLIDERQYLEDPDAAWKDRLDPAVNHPRWRITVRWWKNAKTEE